MSFADIRNFIEPFLSTPSARRATTIAQPDAAQCVISIHALREEGDPPIRSPTHQMVLFLSTPSARRATGVTFGLTLYNTISIHALREEGDRELRLARVDIIISIHALREEGDSKNREKILCFCLSIYQSAQNWQSGSGENRKFCAER